MMAIQPCRSSQGTPSPNCTYCRAADRMGSVRVSVPGVGRTGQGRLLLLSAAVVS
jgi:hypothetical protein